MGNIVASFVNGFFRVIGNLFGASLDFLSGKNCSSICEPTWDLVCYIENFCVSNLLKLLAAVILLYIVLLFFYLLHKVGICGCICRGTCKIFWACLVSCYATFESGCMLMWFKLNKAKRMRERRFGDIEEYGSTVLDEDDLEESISLSHTPREIRYRRWLSQRSRDRRRMDMKKSLKPRSHHRISIGIGRDSIYMKERHPGIRDRHATTVHNIKVTRTSKFVQKANQRRIQRRR